jgi:hypothetical protein
MAVRRAYEKATGAQKNVPSAVLVTTKSKGTGLSLSPMTEPMAMTAITAPQTPVRDDGADVQMRRGWMHSKNLTRCRGIILRLGA